MLTRTKTAVAGMAAAAMIAASSLAVVPAAQAETVFQNGMVQTVAWKGNKGKWRQGNNWRQSNNWNNRGRWHNNGNNWVGPAIGFGTGLFIGSLLAQPRVYAQPRGYNHDAYCHQIHPSYKSWSGTYTTYSGREVPC